MLFCSAFTRVLQPRIAGTFHFIALLAICLCSLRATGQDNSADKKRVLAVLEQLRRQPQWQHLKESDVTLDERIVRNGPELNATLKVQSPDNRPVQGALVVIIESQYDLANYVYRSLPQSYWQERLTPPLAIGTTNESGEVEFRHVRRSAAGQPRSEKEYNTAQATAMVLHADYGFTAQMLNQTDAFQSLVITLSTPASYSGQLINKGSDSLTEAELTMSSWSPREGNGADPLKVYTVNTPFSPRAKIAMDGTFSWQGLPSKGWISLRLLHSTLKLDLPKSYNGTELSSTPLSLSVVADSETPARIFRCIDAETEKPIAGCKVGRIISRESTDEQGEVASKDYDSFSMKDKDGSTKKAINFSVRPPIGYVPVNCYLEDNQELTIRLDKANRIAGRVVDKETGEGIRGVVLNISTVEKIRSTFGCRPDVFANTDEDGRFEAYVPRTKIIVQIQSLVWGYEVPIQTPSQDRRANDSEPKTFISQTVDANNALNNDIQFKLLRTKPIQGVVLDENGKPVANVPVTCQQLVLRQGFSTATTTNDRGEFQVFAVPSGTRTCRLTAMHGTKSSKASANFNQQGSYDGKPIELKLGDGAEETVVVGRVLVDGKGHPNVSVAVFRSEQNQLRGGAFTSQSTVIGQGETDEQGEYRVEVNDLEAEVYYVSPIRPEQFRSWSHQTLALREGENRYPNIEFRTRYGNLSVSGQVVTPDGNPLAGASVRASPRQRVQLVQLDGDKRSASQDTSGVSDKEGRFECKNLDDGKIELQIFPREGYDAWSSAAFHSIVTKGGASNLILTVDPKLSVPPPRLEHVSTSKPESLVPLDRFKPNGQSYTVKGKTTTENGRPIAGAAVFVISARPTEGPTLINPLMHPVCGTKCVTGTDGTYELSVPDNGLDVCLGIIKDGYLPSTSGYISEGENEVNTTLSVKPKVQAELGFNWNTGIPNAMLVVSKSPSAGFLDGFVDKGIERTDLADGQGVLVAPRSYSHDADYLIFSPGTLPRLLNLQGAFNARSEGNRIYSVRARIVNEKGPVANYPVCCSGSLGETAYRTKTDEQGVFRLDGLMFRNAHPTFEFYVYGDIQARDGRGWLHTRVIPNQADGVVVDLGDLKLDPTRKVRLSVKRLDKSVDTEKVSVSMRLRQRGSGTLTIPLKGGSTAIYDLPCEPIILNFELGRNRKLFSTEPEYQQIGFTEHGSLIGLPMDTDVDLTADIAIQ